MLKKTITYTDFNGDEVSEDFFFHLSQAELVELEMSHEGGLSEALQRIIASNDGKSIIAEFKKIVLGSYGKRSTDGKRFIKNDELREEFESSEAYSTLFMELVTDAGKAAEFVNGIIPTGLPEKAAQLTAVPKPAPVPAKEGTVPRETFPPATDVPRKITRKEFTEMSAEEVTKLGEQLQSGEAIIVD